MKFIYPAFLFSLVAIAIPILIHLYSFRRYKTVYFSHVDFLKEIKKESGKKSQLKQLLILAARIMTIISLVFAFSQPYIPDNITKEGSKNEIIAVYVDNSFSMNALSEKGTLLEQARSRAVEIAQSYPPGTKLRLFTNNMLPKHRQTFTREQFIREVSEIEISPSVLPLSLVNNRFDIQNQSSEENAHGIVYFISDFQRIITDPENFKGETTSGYLLPMIPNQVNNLYIDSCWVEVPAHGLNQKENISVKIINNSGEDYSNLPLNLYLNDSLKSITNFSVNANSEINTTLSYTNITGGLQLGTIELTDYPFTHDNYWYLSYFVEPKIKVLAVYDNNEGSVEGLSYISALFENDDYVTIETMNIRNLQISRLSAYNTIFLINPGNFSTGFLNELEFAVSNGTSVVLFPATDIDFTVNNTFLSKFNASLINGIDTTEQKITGIDTDNRFFENVFEKKAENAIVPAIKTHLKFEKNMRTDETNLLWFPTRDKALSVIPHKNGRLWVFSFPLNKRNEAFAKDILFVPSLYNIVLTSLPGQKISYTIGKDLAVLIPPGTDIDMEKPVEIKNPDLNTAFIPGLHVTNEGSRLETGNMIETAGHYLVRNGDSLLTSLAFNYDRKESDLRYFSNSELEDIFTSSDLSNYKVFRDSDRNFQEIFRELQKGKTLWKWFILSALLFILAEVLISRLWR